MTKPSKDDVKKAITTILEYIGENPSREGLLKTPERVVESYSELFKGYNEDPAEVLNAKFFDIGNFQDFVILKNIQFYSFCEHHMLPIIGTVDIAYIPDNCVIGVSKLARIVEIFARRLQIQEKMTTEIADSLQNFLKPKGVAVRISAAHSCMSMRGVLQSNSMMETMHYTGVFIKDLTLRNEFLERLEK